MDLQPLFEIAGIAGATMLVEYIMDKTGHGDKNVFIRIVGYGVCAAHGLRVWWRYLKMIAAMFGVYV